MWKEEEWGRVGGGSDLKLSTKMQLPGIKIGNYLHYLASEQSLSAALSMEVLYPNHLIFSMVTVLTKNNVKTRGPGAGGGGWERELRGSNATSTLQ